MLQRACPTAKNVVLSTSRLCLHNKVSSAFAARLVPSSHDQLLRLYVKLGVQAPFQACHVQQPSHRCLHTQFRSAQGQWQQRCKHAGIKGLALVSATGLAVHCMAADQQVITEKVVTSSFKLNMLSGRPFAQAALSFTQILSSMQATGVTFPEVTKFWQGDSYRCMGAGVRTKKVAFVGVKVMTLCLHLKKMYLRFYIHN